MTQRVSTRPSPLRRAPRFRRRGTGENPTSTAFPARAWTALTLVTAVVLAALLVGVGVSPAQARSHSGSRAAALVTSTTAHVLVTPKGRAVYVFASDSKNKSACYGQCARFWPPILVKKGTTAPSKIRNVPGTFGVAPRKGGTKQLTYDGAPLYTFIEDKKKGDMNGQGLIAAGNYWWVVVAAGK